MEQQLCVLACSAMGETGALIAALLAFVWGLYQRRAKVETAAQNQELAAERTKLEAERTKLEAEIKVLSVRPPPMPTPTFVIQAASPTSMPPSTPTPPPPDEPFPTE